MVLKVRCVIYMKPFERIKRDYINLVECREFYVELRAKNFEFEDQRKKRANDLNLTL